MDTQHLCHLNSYVHANQFHWFHRFRAIKLQTFWKGGCFSQNHWKKLLFSLTLKVIVNKTCKQNFNIISNLLLVLWIIEFLNGDFNVKFTMFLNVSMCFLKDWTHCVGYKKSWAWKKNSLNWRFLTHSVSWRRNVFNFSNLASLRTSCLDEFNCQPSSSGYLHVYISMIYFKLRNSIKMRKWNQIRGESKTT